MCASGVGSTDAGVGSVVVGVDESDGARHALLWAAREAELHRWCLTAVSAWGFTVVWPAVALND